MIQVVTKVWLGDSKDAAEADLKAPGIQAILNVAHDLPGVRSWKQGVEYAQAGLVDGPGNTIAAYYSAVFKLVAFMLGGRRVLVHDHEAGGRSVAVIIMAMHALHRRGWDYWYAAIREKLGHDVEVHEAHRKAFNCINWRLVCTALEGLM